MIGSHAILLFLLFAHLYPSQSTGTSISSPHCSHFSEDHSQCFSSRLLKLAYSYYLRGTDPPLVKVGDMPILTSYSKDMARIFRVQAMEGVAMLALHQHRALPALCHARPSSGQYAQDTLR